MPFAHWDGGGSFETNAPRCQREGYYGSTSCMTNIYVSDTRSLQNLSVRCDSKPSTPILFTSISSLSISDCRSGPWFTPWCTWCRSRFSVSNATPNSGSTVSSKPAPTSRFRSRCTLSPCLPGSCGPRWNDFPSRTRSSAGSLAPATDGVCSTPTRKGRSWSAAPLLGDCNHALPEVPPPSTIKG